MAEINQKENKITFSTIYIIFFFVLQIFVSAIYFYTIIHCWQGCEMEGLATPVVGFVLLMLSLFWIPVLIKCFLKEEYLPKWLILSIYFGSISLMAIDIIIALITSIRLLSRNNYGVIFFAFIMICVPIIGYSLQFYWARKFKFKQSKEKADFDMNK